MKKNLLFRCFMKQYKGGIALSKKGIDVSTWQKDINWQAVKDSGIEFVMVRSGYGRGGENQIDDKFKNNINGAQGVGLNVGAYHYSYAESVDDAVTEAEFCLSIIKGYKFTYPIAFDIEDDSMKNLSKRELTDICKAFCNRIEQEGYYASIYTNIDWLNNYLYKDELLNRYDLWLAQWEAESPSFDCGIWQYSSSGSINGINGNVDLNISYKDYPSIINGLSSDSKDSSSMQDDTSSNLFEYYTVKTGDTLSKIASDYGTTYNYLADINNIPNADLIYAGQKIMVPSSNKSAGKYTMYTVVSNDTLWEIAQTYLNDGSRYNEIKALNGLTSDTIYPGQILKIPNN